MSVGCRQGFDSCHDEHVDLLDKMLVRETRVERVGETAVDR